MGIYRPQSSVTAKVWHKAHGTDAQRLHLERLSASDQSWQAQLDRQAPALEAWADRYLGIAREDARKPGQRKRKTQRTVKARVSNRETVAKRMEREEERRVVNQARRRRLAREEAQRIDEMCRTGVGLIPKDPSLVDALVTDDWR